MTTDTETRVEHITAGVSRKAMQRGYYLYVTEACNLRCSYCFVRGKQNDRHLSQKTADQFLRFVAQDAESLSTVYVHFFGGEPLIRLDMIEYLATRLEEWSSGRGLKLRLGVTTNGTLLSTETCEMLRAHNVGVQLSLDGSKEGNDIHRRFPPAQADTSDGSGSFDHVKIANYIFYFGKNAPNCRMTLTVQNLPFLYRSICELYALGFRSFSIIPDSDSGAWTQAFLEKYQSVMEEVFRFWTQHPDVWINTIDKTLAALMSKSRSHRFCRVGASIIGVTVDGDFYPCHDFAGLYSKEPAGQQLNIGNISSGYNENYYRFLAVPVESDLKSGCGYDCASCWARRTCARGCPYMNYAISGNIAIVNPTYCATQRIDTLLVLKWVASLDYINLSFPNQQKLRRVNEFDRNSPLPIRESFQIVGAVWRGDAEQPNVRN